MKTLALSVLLVFMIVQIQVNAQKFSPKKLSVTIYNDNLGVVKDLREYELPKGQTKIEIQDVAQLIDPTTVHINFKGEVIEQNYQYDLVSLEKILSRYIDREIELIGEKDDLISGKLLSAGGNSIVLQKKSGGLEMLTNLEKYRITVNSLPEGLITKPTLVCLANSDIAGKQDVELTYQTKGMNWHTEYVAVLDKDDKSIDMNAWVSIENNSGTSYKDAFLKLIAGDINRVQDEMYLDAAPTMVEGMTKGRQFEEKAFFEYHIYTLERPTTVAQNETKAISLFESKNIGIVKKYLYRSGGYSGSSGKVAVVIEFENSEKNNLGVPMPKGKVRMYKSDGQALEFVGEDLIDHTAKNEKLKLKVGDAFDIVVEENQTEYKQITEKVSESTFEIKIRNQKDEDITVDISRYLGLRWEIRDNNFDFEKVNAQNILFKIPVKAGKESILKYTVRYTY